MIDITAKIKFKKKKDQLLYQRLQMGILTGFILGWIFFSYTLLLPKENYTFSFDNPNSLKNTIINPHEENGRLFFSVQAKPGYFNEIEINLQTKENQKNLTLNKVSAKKSYQSFLYPEFDPVGFKNGYQLKNNDDYYVVSDTELRKFTSPELLTEMGYDINNFQDVGDESLQYNFRGKNITNNAVYPNFTAFKIKDTYYQLNDRELQSFTSEEAFITHYTKSAAITKDEDFLNFFTVDDINPISFASSSLISVGDAIYVVDGKSIVPVDSPLTFEASGFKWEDVRESDNEEAERFQKSKQISLILPQPDGTVFKTVEDKKHYLIDKGRKRLIPNEDIVASYSINTPIIVSEKSLKTESVCELSPAITNKQKYSCQLNINQMNDIIGNNFIFSAKIESQTALKTLDISFKKNLNWQNIHYTLSLIKQRLLLQYDQN